MARYAHSLILTLFTLCLLCVSAAPAHTATIDLTAVDLDLTSQPEHVPYTAESGSGMDFILFENPFRGQSYLFLDIDGDGVDEWLTSNDIYLAAKQYGTDIQTMWNTPFPARFMGKEPSLALSGPFDLNGDGQPEIIVSGIDEGAQHHRFWVVNPVTGLQIYHFTLDSHPEDRPDDELWDGTYIVSGTIEHPNIPGRKALIITCNVGWDIYGRGILAIDPYTGETLWHYDLATNPSISGTQILDIDGDGKIEIIFATRSPHNLLGRKLPGLGNDDISYLMVLSNSGELEWSRELCGFYGNAYLAIGDLDANGSLEIVTTATTTPTYFGRISVWSGNGELLDDIQTEAQFQRPFLGQVANSESLLIMTAAASNGVLTFSFDGDHLLQTGRIVGNKRMYANGFCDILSDPGPELAISDREGNAYILNQDFEVLLHLQDEVTNAWNEYKVFRTGSDEQFLYRYTGYKSNQPDRKIASQPGMLSLYKQKSSINPGLISLAVALPLSLLGFAWYRKRRPAHRGTSSSPTQSDLLAARLRFHAELKRVNHGELGVLESLKTLHQRSKWRYEDLAINPDQESRWRDQLLSSWRDFQEITGPAVTDILALANAASLDTTIIERTGEQLQTILGVMANIETQSNEIDQMQLIQTVLENGYNDLPRSLLRLRAESETGRRIAPPAILQRVLRAHSQTLATGKITLTIQGSPADPGVPFTETPTKPLCFISENDLTFILENLVGNAVRAMKDAPRCQLNINWSKTGNNLHFEVTDTGCGMAPGDMFRYLNTGASTRDGGGSGLPISVEMLARYGGNLEIVRSSPDDGCTMRVTLPLATEAHNYTPTPPRSTEYRPREQRLSSETPPGKVVSSTNNPRRLIIAFTKGLLLVLLVVALIVACLIQFRDPNLSLVEGRLSVSGPIFNWPRWESPTDQFVTEAQLGPWRDLFDRRVIYSGGLNSNRVYSLKSVNALSGRILWSRNISQEDVTRVFGGKNTEVGVTTCNSFCFADLFDDGELEIVAGFIHRVMYPAIFRAYDRDGNTVASYYNPGHFNSMTVADLNADGRDEVVIGGTNNSFDGATIIVLDGDHFSGAAQDSSNSRQFAVTMSDSSRFRLIMPGHNRKLMKQLDFSRFHATSFSVFQTAMGETRIKMSIGSPWSMQGAYLLFLDSELNPLQLIATDGLKTLVRRKIASGLLDQDITTPEFCNEWLSRSRRYVSGHLVPKDTNSITFR